MITYDNYGYFLDFRGDLRYFKDLGGYYDYLISMNDEKVKDFPRLDKRRILNLFLVEFEGEKLGELEKEDERMLVESY